MKLLPVLLSLLTLGSALPTAELEAEAAALPENIIEERAIAPHTPKFYLKTKSSKPQFDGLYLGSYHTGAGLGDAGLYKWNGKGDFGWRAFLNATYLQFDTGENFPWILEVSSFQPYTDWAFTTINIGGPPLHRKNPYPLGFNASGLVVTGQSPSWNGWLACRWWHGGDIQLFSTGSDFNGVLSSCSLVELHKVAI